MVVVSDAAIVPNSTVVFKHLPEVNTKQLILYGQAVFLVSELFNAGVFN